MSPSCYLTWHPVLFLFSVLLMFGSRELTFSNQCLAIEHRVWTKQSKPEFFKHWLVSTILRYSVSCGGHHYFHSSLSAKQGRNGWSFAVTYCHPGWQRWLSAPVWAPDRDDNQRHPWKGRPSQQWKLSFQWCCNTTKWGSPRQETSFLAA